MSKNKNWRTKDGKRWQRAERIAIARLFRAHVDTPSNRRHGRSCRIRRQGCFWHPSVEAEAHHIDYSRPFVVAWVGLVCGCHRKIEHGTLTIPRKAIWDYTSLIEGPYGVVGGRVRLRKAKHKSNGCSCPKRPHGAPHEPDCPKHPLTQVVSDSDVPF